MLRDWPIERKIMLGTLFITLAALSFVSAFLIVAEFRSVRESRLSSTVAFASMIATNAAASIIYSDLDVAQEILSGIQAEPSAKAAALYNASGQLYAWFPTNLPPHSLPPRVTASKIEFTPRGLEVCVDVVWRNRQAGWAWLSMDLAGMNRRFRMYLITAAIVSVATILLSLLLAKAFQRWIAGPILSLSRTAKLIAQKGDYSLRAAKTGNDEVGQLVEAFNHMVEQAALSQRKMQNYAADLEKEVAARTDQLRETISDLESFSYSISHDIRAPLRAMQGYAQFLAEDCKDQLSQESAGYLERIMRASVRLDALIQDILAYSRMVRGELDIQRIDLDQVLNDVLSEFPRLTLGDLTIEIQSPLGSVCGHAAALSQVFSNLIGNAVKFQRPGVKPCIVIRAESRGKFRRVFVQDNGLGIAEKDFQRIFGIFERVHSSQAFEGTGIGLSIVKKAVEKMGGTVGVQSQLNAGSTFWFELEESSSPDPNALRPA